MDCKEFRELLDLYVDGELSAEAAEGARSHLKGCASCARTEAQLRRLRHALKRVVLRHQPPAGLEREVRSSVRAGRVHPPGESPTGVVPLWRSRVSLPAPVFALLVTLTAALCVWTVVARRPVPAQTTVSDGRKAPPVSPGAAPTGESDLPRFERGDRASIHVVRRAGAGR